MTFELVEGDPKHLQLIEEVEAKKVELQIDANKSLGWLMGQDSSQRLPIEKGLAFNYIQWLILMPGIVALFLIPIIPALILLAGCAVLSWLVNRIKSQLLQAGIKEFIKQDLDSLNELYENRAIKLRRRQPKNQPLIQFPQPWAEVLSEPDAAENSGGESGLMENRLEYKTKK